MTHKTTSSDRRGAADTGGQGLGGHLGTGWFSERVGEHPTCVFCAHLTVRPPGELPAMIEGTGGQAERGLLSEKCTCMRAFTHAKHVPDLPEDPRRGKILHDAETCSQFMWGKQLKVM